MKALTIMQPWATLVVAGQKRYETRSWATRHRGPLLIASSARFPPEFEALCAREPFRTALAACGVASPRPTGCILGTVLLTACRSTTECGLVLSETERAFGDFGPARYAWELCFPRRLPTPIPFRGALGLFDVPDALIPEEFR